VQQPCSSNTFRTKVFPVQKPPVSPIACMELRFIFSGS
jgi:hypothetical protein